MQNTFTYSDHTCQNVIKYLLDNHFLSEKDIETLKNKSKTDGLSVFSIFLNENPQLEEKAASLISHISGKPFFDSKENIAVINNDTFSLKNISKYGSCLINDGEGQKLLCLDPSHEGLEKAVKEAELTDVPKYIISNITFEYIKKNYNKLSNVKIEEIRKHNAKTNVAILDSEDVEAADANTFVYNMLKECIEKNASDIHIDLAIDNEGQVGFKLRNRVDGKCFDIGFYSDILLYRGIVNKLKLDAGLKIDERRLPQDGRISFEMNGIVYNFRLSFMPNTVRNSQEEKIVLRLLPDLKKCDLYGLDILPYNLKYLEDALAYPFGFVCVTGPTGSGKTTLLYAILQQIDRTSKNVITLEDPIEAEIPLVNQSQTFHRIGYDFAAGLRVILRQDPDIIMVGEMRDEETAMKAFEAANTGHLVFSTLHTNTAASSITRLLQMKVPYYFISSALKFVVAQRLVRRVCEKCKRPHPDEKKILHKIEEAFSGTSKNIKSLFNEVAKKPLIYTSGANGHSCEHCNNTGFKGRMAILEVMKVDDEIRRIINFDNGNEAKIEEAGIKNGMLPILHYGYIQALKGLTTFEEVNNAVLSV
jgi:type IV pilus assembly protein PilB